MYAVLQGDDVLERRSSKQAEHSLRAPRALRGKPDERMSMPRRFLNGDSKEPCRGFSHHLASFIERSDSLTDLSRATPTLQCFLADPGWRSAEKKRDYES